MDGRIVWLSSSLLCGVLCACGPGDATPVASASVGALGGAVSLPDGTALVIPPAALSSTTRITFTPVTAAVPGGNTVLGNAYDLGPEGLQFQRPAELTLAFDPSRLPPAMAGTAIAVLTAPAGSMTYSALAVIGIDATHVKVQVSHFSTVVPVANGGNDGAVSCLPGGRVVCAPGNAQPGCPTPADCCHGAASCDAAQCFCSNGCGPYNAVCAADADCCAGSCTSFPNTDVRICCEPYGSSCSNNADCCGLYCSSGRCCAVETVPCTSDGQCCSGACIGGACAAATDGGVSDLSGVPDLADVPDLAPSCSDGIRDGLETDVDCGGPACPRCALGKYCATNTDCSSGVCTPMPQAPGEPGGVCTS